MNLVTMVYQLEGEGDKLHYTPIHENSTQMLKVALLNTKKVRVLGRLFFSILILDPVLIVKIIYELPCLFNLDTHMTVHKWLPQGFTV